MIENLIFWTVAPVMILAALGVVFHPSIVYAALLLIGVFLSIACLFLLNNADFLAITQGIVYAVGLTIVLLFGIMFTGDKPFRWDGRVSLSRYLAYGVVAFFSVSLLVWGVAQSGYLEALPTRVYPPELIPIIQQQGTTGLLGQLLFQKYVLPFELASVLLLVAMMGAIVIAKKSFSEADAAPGKTTFTLDTGSELSVDARLVDKALGYTGAPAGSSGVADNMVHADAELAPEVMEMK